MARRRIATRRVTKRYGRRKVRATARRRVPTHRRRLRRPVSTSGALSRRRTYGLAPRRYGARRVMHNRSMTAKTTRRGDIVIEHQEFIGDLIPSTNGSFLSQVYAINPGLSSVFPFVSGIANQYEEYDPVYMQVILKSTSGNALSSANAALGTMGITPVYNTYTSTSSIGSKYIAESYDGATSGPPSKSQILKLQTKNSRNPLDTYFVRNGAVPSGQTSSMTDVCNLVVWTSGLQTTTASPVAEIWIRYKIILKSTKPGNLLNQDVSGAHYTATTGISTSAYFGTSNTPTQAAGSTQTWTFTGTVATGPKNIAVGNYLCVYQVTSGSVAAVGPTIAASGTATALSLFNNAATSLLVNPPSAGAASTVVDTVFAFTVTGASPTLTFSGATFGASPTSMDFVITALPAGMV